MKEKRKEKEGERGKVRDKGKEGEARGRKGEGEEQGGREGDKRW